MSTTIQSIKQFHTYTFYFIILAIAQALKIYAVTGSEEIFSF